MTDTLLAKEQIPVYKPFNMEGVWFSNQYVITNFDILEQKPLYHPLIPVDEKVVEKLPWLRLDVPSHIYSDATRPLRYRPNYFHVEMD